MSWLDFVRCSLLLDSLKEKNKIHNTNITNSKERLTSSHHLRTMIPSHTTVGGIITNQDIFHLHGSCQRYPLIHYRMPHIVLDLKKTLSCCYSCIGANVCISPQPKSLTLQLKYLTKHGLKDLNVKEYCPWCVKDAGECHGYNAPKNILMIPMSWMT